MAMHHHNLSSAKMARKFNAGLISMTDEERIDMPLIVIAAHQAHERLIHHSTKKVAERDIWEDISKEGR